VKRRALVSIVAASALAAGAGAQDAAAPAPQGKVLPLQGKVLDIVGVTLGLDAVLRDLGAKVTPEEIRIELSADVLFDFDSAALRPEAVASLRKVAALVAAHPARPVRIDGHTDAKGADDYNQALSERRAASVKDWLVKDGGIEASRISTRGLGESQPKAANQKPDGSDDPDGRQQNRRVEITIQTG
jgi:outer membrane protein OmpA-like peptidoglycan-associated protein